VDFGISVKPDKVYVNVGDSVEPGQKLMDIDKAETTEAFDSLTGVQNYGAATDSGVTEDAASAFSSEEYTQFMQQENGNSVTSSGADQGDGTADVNGDDSDDSIDDVPDSVYSDISGIVTKVDVDEGSFTQPADPLIVISDLSSIQVKAQVDESMISQVKKGQTAIISGAALTSKYTGEVTQVYPTANTLVTVNGTETVVNVIISIDKADRKLLPGLDTNVEILTKQNKSAIILPYEAVQEDNANQKYVYVYSRGRAERKNIQTGNEYTSTVEVVSGVNKGDIIITNPPAGIKNGTKIILKNIVGE
jgi:multidrug efflux pump subunit AcrA (membrane-fusion protein)